MVATAQIFGLHPIISGTGKGRSLKFCTHILSIDRNKSPFQISAKVAVGVVRDSRNFPRHPLFRFITEDTQIQVWNHIML